MSSTHAPDITEQLANDYANYAKIDLPKQMKDFRDTIEDVMIRLEEFQSIISMAQMEGAECMNNYIPSMQSMKTELITLCKRVDTLEHVVATANVSLCALETAVDNAEAELGVSDRLFGLLNPLSFFKKTQESISSGRVPSYEPPTIYKTDDYFKKE